MEPHKRGLLSSSHTFVYMVILSVLAKKGFLVLTYSGVVKAFPAEEMPRVRLTFPSLLWFHFAPFVETPVVP